MAGFAGMLYFISAGAFTTKLRALKTIQCVYSFIQEYKLEYLFQQMTERDIDRIIEMAWEDRTPFEAIEMQFEVSESEVVKLMRKELKESSFKMWRKRVNSGVSQKHLKKRSAEINRFKCSRQRNISNNKIS